MSKCTVLGHPPVKRGRPPRGEYADTRAALTARITAELRGSLDWAADENNRSLSQEVEHRLRSTFAGGPPLPDCSGSATLCQERRLNAKTVDVECEVVDGKNDASKPKIATCFLQQFPRAIEAVAAVMEYGATKTDRRPFGWLHLHDGDNRYADSQARHMLKEFKGEQYDTSGIVHRAHLATNALIRLERELVEREEQGLTYREPDPI